MNIQGNSILDTVIEYANVKFGIELTADQVSEQLKNMRFNDTLKLVNAIKTENDDDFADLIDMSAVNEAGYGTTGTQQPSSATIRRDNVRQQQDIRRDTNLALKSALRSNPNDRQVAGAGKVKPTGSTASSEPDQSNADTVAQNAETSSANSKEIERLRQLINKGTDRQR